MTAQPQIKKELTGITVAENFCHEAGKEITFSIDSVIDWGMGRMYGRGKQKFLFAKVEGISLLVWIQFSKFPLEEQKQLKQLRDMNEYCPYPTRGLISANFKKRKPRKDSH